MLTGVSSTTLGRRLENTETLDVLFCDVTGNAIWKWSATESASASSTGTSPASSTFIDTSSDLCSASDVTVEVSAYQSGCSLQNHPEGCGNVYYKGCGGMAVDPTSNKIVVARTGGRTLGVLSYVNVDGECQGQVVDAITTYRGKKFNSPTYTTFSPQGGDLYFSDSPFGLATSASDLNSDALDDSSQREIPFNGLYVFRNTTQEIELVDCTMDRPNKIAFSPEGDVMYVSNSKKGDSYVKAFNVSSNGSIGDSSIFFNFTAHPELNTGDGYADGIKVDADGNVYVAAYNGIFVFTNNGTLAGAIRSSQEISDIALGDGRLFATGPFGIISQSSTVQPAQAIPKAVTTCS